MASLAPLFVNNWSTTLASSVASGATTSFSLTSATGLPTIGTNQYIPAVVVDTSTSPETVKEYVYITAVSGTTATVTRAAEDSSTYAAAALATGLTVAAVATRESFDMVSYLGGRYQKPSAAAFESFPRFLAGNNGVNLISGRLFLTAIALPAGFSVGRIAFVSGSSGSTTTTNWWFALFDSGFAQLATTADQLTTTWASNTTTSLAISTTAAGAATSFTTTYTGLYYLGVCVSATSVPSLTGLSTMQNGVNGLAPTLGGNSTSGLSSPPAFPSTATTPSNNPTPPWAYAAA